MRKLAPTQVLAKDMGRDNLAMLLIVRRVRLYCNYCVAPSAKKYLVDNEQLLRRNKSTASPSPAPPRLHTLVLIDTDSAAVMLDVAASRCNFGVVFSRRRFCGARQVRMGSRHREGPGEQIEKGRG